MSPSPLIESPPRNKSKLKLSFSPKIEKVCVFESSESPVSIHYCNTYTVRDHGNMDVSSISSSYKLYNEWKLVKSNQKHTPTFQDSVVILDSIVLKDRQGVQGSFHSQQGPLLVGHVLVRNLSFEKQISIRFSTDGWKTCKDIRADFVGSVTPSYGDYIGIDRFYFTIDLDLEFMGSKVFIKDNSVHSSLYFAIKYHVNGMDYWDNNHCNDYKCAFEKNLKNFDSTAEKLYRVNSWDQPSFIQNTKKQSSHQQQQVKTIIPSSTPIKRQGKSPKVAIVKKTQSNTGLYNSPNSSSEVLCRLYYSPVTSSLLAPTQYNQYESVFLHSEVPMSASEYAYQSYYTRVVAPSSIMKIDSRTCLDDKSLSCH